MTLSTYRHLLRRSNEHTLPDSTNLRQTVGKDTISDSTKLPHPDPESENKRNHSRDTDEASDASSTTPRRPGLRAIRGQQNQNDIPTIASQKTNTGNNLANAFSIGPKLGQRLPPKLATTFKPKANAQSNVSSNGTAQASVNVKSYAQGYNQPLGQKTPQPLSHDELSDGKARNGRQPSLDGGDVNHALGDDDCGDGVTLGIPAGSGPGGKVNIVILGGSFTGLSVAVTLAKNPPRDASIITIVEPKSYLEVRWATIRSLFDEETCSNSTISLSKILSSHPMIRHVRARAIGVEMDAIRLDDDRALPYDVLLVATGAVHSFTALTPHLSPGTLLPPGDALEERRRFLKETGDTILKCRSVAVIGGGPVGTELAADIASYGRARGRHVNVTLIDNKEKLMPDYPRSVSQKLREKLTKLDVRLILGQRAQQADDGSWVLLESGENIQADMVLKTTGVAPSAKGIFGVDSESVRDGWVRTDRHGRVIGCRGDVFAGGDCCDWSAKSGENTLANRNALSHNLRLTAEAIANCRALASIDSRLKRVSVSHRPPAIVASAPRDGEIKSPFAALSPSWWWMKNRGIMLAKAQKEIGW